MSSGKWFVSNWVMTLQIRYGVFSKHICSFITFYISFRYLQWETTLTWCIQLWHIIDFRTVSSGMGHCGCHMNKHKTHSCWKQLYLIYIMFLCSMEREVIVITSLVCIFHIMIHHERSWSILMVIEITYQVFSSV